MPPHRLERRQRFAPCAQVDNQERRRDQPAQRRHQRRRHRLERDADAEVGGAPDDADRSPREVREAPFARRRGRRHDAITPPAGAGTGRDRGQPRPAVDGEHFAGDVAGVLGDEERDRVGHLFRPAPPLQRHGFGDAFDRLGRVPELFRGARRFDRPRRNRVDADVVARPFDGERLRHRHHARLRRGRVDGAGAAGPDVVRQDRDDRAAASLMDHLPADRARAVERAVQHDADDRVPSVGREILGAADEVARGVVDEDVDVPEVLDRALDELVDLLGVAHVDLDGQRIESGMTELCRSGLEVRRVPAADDDARAERTEALRDGETDARAATGDDGHATLEHLGTKHERSDYRRSRFAGSRVRVASGFSQGCARTRTAST